MRWSRGALGRVPRFAQRRVILFFCPTLASSANQTSIAAGLMPFSRAISATTAGKLFKKLDRSLSLGMVARPSAELAIAKAAQLAT